VSAGPAPREDFWPSTFVHDPTREHTKKWWKKHSVLLQVVAKCIDDGAISDESEEGFFDYHGEPSCQWFGLFYRTTRATSTWNGQEDQLMNIDVLEARENLAYLRDRWRAGPSEQRGELLYCIHEYNKSMILYKIYRFYIISINIIIKSINTN
jgi:alpha-glucosidase (family GH31 glycosyl hydrolase)